MNMKKLALTVLALSQISLAFAGGILTNTNQSARFARLMALEASTNADAAYYNPAGLAFLKKDGFHFSFSNQSAFQTREITSTFAPFVLNGGSNTKYFEGTASAPIIPSLQGAYKKGDWVLSGSIAVIGGGGKATFSDGLPSFEGGIAAIAAGTGASQYTLDQYMRGSSFIYGAQMGGTYKFNEMFSAHLGFRLNIVNNGYEGYLKNIQFAGVNAGTYLDGVYGQLKGAGDGLQPLVDNGAGAYTMAQVLGAGHITQAQFDALKAGLKNPEGFGNYTVSQVQGAYYDSSNKVAALKPNTVDRELDVKQTGWGITPIIGFHFNYEKLNIGVKYEHKAHLNLENKTVDGKDAGMSAYKDGVNTAHDIPGLFTIGASYGVLPKLTASVGYHHFFDSGAKMANDKQKYTGNGTNEYLAGLEYKINDMFLVSTGGQITRYGIKDDFQSDISFSVNSYSLGFGGAANISENVQLNIGYFFTDYSNYTKNTANYYTTGIAGKDVYTRTNKVFTVGIDFSF